MDAAIFLAWLDGVFAHALPVERPCLLLMNVQEAIVSYDVMQWLSEHRVTLVPIPNGAHDFVQPLRHTVFPALRSAFYELADKTLGIKEGGMLDKCDLAKLWSDTLSCKCTPALIKEAFRKCQMTELIDKAKVKVSEPANNVKNGDTCSAPDVSDRGDVESIVLTSDVESAVLISDAESAVLISDDEADFLTSVDPTSSTELASRGALNTTSGEAQSVSAPSVSIQESGSCQGHDDTATTDPAVTALQESRALRELPALQTCVTSGKC